ncbi:MAG TPA: PAS domain S-box protein [Pirellulaceae bacterium]|jgi:PAS domain S-box-containing protein|nr:PAS domain S-box protein [Pirellulaceae bacterium]
MPSQPIPASDPALLQDAEQFQRIVGDIKDYAIFLLDAGGHVVTWNAGAQEIKGYRPDEILGQRFTKFYPEEAIARGWPDHELEVASREGRFEDEGWRVRKDGTLLWANVVITALKDATGHVRGFSKITRDLTERKRHEEDLRESEERFRLMVESVRDYAIFMLDPDGRVATWNAGAQHIKGYSADEIIGQHFSRFYPADAVARKWPDQELVIARNEGRFEEEGWRVRKDGTFFWANVVITALRDSKGNIRGFSKVTRDLTERKQSEERLRESNVELERRVDSRTAELNESNAALREANRRKDEFLAILAHELRNPLAPLRTGLDLLKYAADDAQMVAETRLVMEQQLGQMIRLIDDLLEISRLNQGKMRLRKERMDLSAAVKLAVQSVQPMIDEAGQRLTVELPGEPVPLFADPVRISQVVANLLSNASKYSERGDRIEVKVSRQGEEAIVSVRDEGVGIAPVHLPRLFEMFSQVDSSLERSKGGLGIGLALVKGLVDMHQGSVTAFSDGPGTGSEFVVALPLARLAERRDEAAESGDEASAPRCRILIADDNKVAVNILSKMLTLMGHEVYTAYDGVEALEKAAAYQPRLVLLDIGMPRMNGYETARKIRAEVWGQEMSLVAVTGWGQDEDKRRAAEAGFDRHVTKPIETEAVRNLVNEAMRR